MDAKVNETTKTQISELSDDIHVRQCFENAKGNRKEFVMAMKKRCNFITHGKSIKIWNNLSKKSDDDDQKTAQSEPVIGNEPERKICEDEDEKDYSSSDVCNILEDKIEVRNNGVYGYYVYHQEDNKINDVEALDTADILELIMELGHNLLYGYNIDTNYILQGDEHKSMEEISSNAGGDQKEQSESDNKVNDGKYGGICDEQDQIGNILFFRLNDILRLVEWRKYDEWEVYASNAVDRYYHRCVLPLMMQLLQESNYLLSFFLISIVAWKNFYYFVRFHHSILI